MEVGVRALIRCSRVFSLDNARVPDDLISTLLYGICLIEFCLEMSWKWFDFRLFLLSAM
jgi:hypothetical protein